MRRHWLGIALLLYSCPELTGQDTRTAFIEKARDEKASQLTPYEPPKAERKWVSVQAKWLEPILGASDGLHLRIGNLPPGSGVALGPEYIRTDLLGGRLAFRAGARASTRKWLQGTASLAAPRLLDGLAFASTELAYRNYGSVQYYGSGPKSEKTGRSDYRYEETGVEARSGLTPLRGLRAGVIGGFSAINVGPGNRTEFASSEQQFSAAVAPGIDRQTSFWREGGFVLYDWRNYPGEATRGGLYSAQYLHNSDRSLSSFSFGRLDLDLNQFVPLTRTSVFAIRGFSSLTNTGDGQRVPFYLQPRLGGPNDLRGYRADRFYGDNRIGGTAEYRWEASPALGMALFVDTGKVFDHWSQWNVHDMEASYGFGFRFKNQHNPVFRVDTAFSSEGFQVWVRFNKLF